MNANIKYYEENIKNEIRNKVYSESEDYILNVNEDEYKDYLVNEHIIEKFQIKKDEIYADNCTIQILGSEHPRSSHVKPNQMYDRLAIKYFIPYEGETKLLNLDSYIFSIEDNCIIFTKVVFDKNTEQINQEVSDLINSLSQEIDLLNSEIDEFNESLEKYIKGLIINKKQAIKKTYDFVSKLNVPIRKKPNTPRTFSIPKPKFRKKIKINKPEVIKRDELIEPTLNPETYNEILSFINDVGKQLERMPSIYKDKGEETLRDFFLLFLEPNFEGSATGETFNKKGKTDILLRHESTNVFVAECKYWKGSKKFLNSITQLFDRYLTWRDSKVAIIIFVKNKDFSSVLNNVKEKVTTHPYYLEFVNEGDETWLNYNFHLSGDKSREIKTAIMLFHVP